MTTALRREGAGGPMSNMQHREFSLPEEFDHRKPSHTKNLKEYVGSKYGEGWGITGINIKTRTVTIEQFASADVVSDANADRKLVNLAEGTKKSDGEAKASSFEQNNPGYVMTDFQPLLRQAELTKMSPETKSARQAIANVLRCKPWEVKIAPRTDGGYSIGLPETYVHSKQYDALCEVVEDTVGSVGWYVDINTKKRRGEIIPSDPPTFPGMIPYPMDQTQIVPTMQLRIGAKLPKPGQEDGGDFTLDLDDSMVQIGGLAGAGKSVGINDLIASGLAAGFELAVADIPDKAVDFDWCRDFVRPYGWGCDSPYETVAMLANLYDEGGQRAKSLKRHKAKKMADLPADIQKTMPFVLIVIDEVTGLFSKEVVPKSLDKDHPMRVEAENKNVAVDLIKSYINKIAAEQRFVGMRIALASQVASRDTGIDTKLRTNLHHKILYGTNPTESNRKLIFPNADSVPLVPDNVKNDSKAGRGVGTASPQGDEAVVFKSYYADTDTLYDYLTKIGVQTHRDQSPTRDMIEEYMPIDLSEAIEQETEAASTRKKMEAEARIDPETGERMSGFEYANLQRSRSTRKADADAASGEGALT